MEDENRKKTENGEESSAEKGETVNVFSIKRQLFFKKFVESRGAFPNHPA